MYFRKVVSTFGFAELRFGMRFKSGLSLFYKKGQNG